MKLEPPEGIGGGGEGEGEREGGRGEGGSQGLGYSPGQQKLASFPAVSELQVCERQCMCVFERERDPCPINVTLYCNHLLWGQGWCSKVNTIGNKLLETRYNPLAGGVHSLIHRMREG